MRNERERGLWSATQDLTLPDLMILACLCGLILILSGCGTMGSPSASPPLSAPPALTDAVAAPVLLPADPTPEDLLENVAANGEACNEMRSRLLAVQRWWAGVKSAP